VCDTPEEYFYNKCLCGQQNIFLATSRVLLISAEVGRFGIRNPAVFVLTLVLTLWGIVGVYSVVTFKMG
jgi:hypothetical protein